ncbi:glycosyltransferase [Macrococcoides caseolyticum]|uniref:glycosyltransferase n=1 Tax=Macrococcoides caseolyticum TaxID=69966 RepID=UPI0018E19020|nr:glycosyltransferase [Macrococcus caseolyticus]QQB05547.1 glycosyltransferase [Macrococcus caseolyticus]
MNRKLGGKILIVITRSNPVSPDPRVEKIISVAKEIDDVTVICWDRELKSQNEKIGNVSFIRIPIESKFGNGLQNLLPLIKWNYKLTLELFKLRKDITVIHACDFDTVLPSIIIKKILGKKLIYDIFDFYVDSFNVPKLAKRLIRWLEIKSINISDFVIIASEIRKKQILGAKQKNIEVINNIPDIKEIKLEKPQNKKNIISYVGILQNNRGLTFMKSLIENKQRNWTFNIAGFGILEEQFKDYPYFYGKVNYDTSLEMSNCSKLLFATYSPDVENHYYSDPNKFYEALALGIPIIVSDNMAIKDLVTKYNVGYVVKYESENDMIECLEDAASLSENYMKKAQNTRQLYVERYNWPKMKSKLEKIYNNYYEK